MRSQTRRFLRYVARDITRAARGVARITAALGVSCLLGWGVLALMTERATEWGERMVYGVVAFVALFFISRYVDEWLEDRWHKAVEDERAAGRAL